MINFADAIHRGLQQDPRRPSKEGDSTLELGELEQLCVNNEAETSYDVSLLHRILSRWKCLRSNRFYIRYY